MATKKTVAVKKVGFAKMTKAQRSEMARKGGLARVKKAKAAAKAAALKKAIQPGTPMKLSENQP